MRTLQLFAAGAATANAVASITIPTAGTLKGCQIAATFDQVADNSAGILEFSKVATGQIGVNGAQDPFLEVRCFCNLGAAGATQFGVNHFFPLKVTVRQGEIIYVHASIATTIYAVTAIFHYE